MISSLKKKFPTRITVFLKHYLSLFFPFFILVSVITVVLYKKDARSEIMAMEKKEFLNVEMPREMIVNEIRSIVSDMVFLSNHHELHELFDLGDVPRRRGLAEEFSAFLQRREIYDRVCFLDEKGREIAKVSYQDGIPTAPPADQLQFKTDQEYFRETFKLDKEKVYISPLVNLDDNSKKPEILFGMSVFDEHGVKKGIIILHYLAEKLLGNLEKFSVKAPGRLMLLNFERLWMEGGKYADKCYHLDKSGAVLPFENAFPEAWQEIARTGTGQFNTSNGMFTFGTVYHLLECKVSSEEDSEFIANHPGCKNCCWKVVSYIPSETLKSKSREFSSRYFLIYAALISSLGFGSLFLARARVNRNLSQVALRSSEERYRVLVENSFDCIGHLDLDGRYIYMNPWGRQLYGWEDFRDIQGIHCVDNLKGEFKGPMKNTIESANNGELARLEFISSTAKGKERWWESVISPIKDHVGQVVSLLQISRDITGWKQTEKELRKAKKEAEEANKIKDKFVSLVAHDLRSPLSSMMGFLELIKDPDCKPDEKDELIVPAIKTGKKMLNLIEELLNLSRLKTGKVRPWPVFVDGCAVVANAISVLVTLAEKKGITVLNRVPRYTRLFADVTLFGQVVNNLVSNAIKFSNPGDTVAIFVPDGKPSTVAVSDTGIGIEPHRLGVLFHYEKKTSTIGTAGEIGTGLGLPLSKDIMEAHKGGLRIESIQNKGTTFYAELPLVRPRILIADDEGAIRMLVRKMLIPLEVEILEAEDGEKALEISKSTPPHLILSDIHMPNRDGLELLMEVRRDESLEGVPFIILTADENMEVKEKAFHLGANDFLKKPITREDLIPKVRKHIV